jgi:hypothetical protein
MHEANLHPPELYYRAVAIGFENLKVRWNAGPYAVFFRHQRADPDAFEPPSRQTGFEARIKHRDGHEPLVVPHVSAEYRRRC